MTAVDNILTEELEALRQAIISNMEAAGAVASRRTIDSMYIEVSDMVGTLHGGLPNGAPIGTFETGRRGGAVPVGFRGIIRQWMDDKGIHAAPIPYKRQPSERWQPKYTPQERGDMAMAGAIAETIRTNGTKLFRDGGRNNIYSPQIDATIKNIQQRILAGLTTEVQHINLNL